MHLRDYQLAMDLLQEMVDTGMPANAEGYATAIRTCARCSKSDEAVFLYANQLRMTVIPSKVRSTQQHMGCGAEFRSSFYFLLESRSLERSGSCVRLRIILLERRGGIKNKRKSPPQAQHTPPPQALLFANEPPRIPPSLPS